MQHKHLLNIYETPGTMLGTRVTTGNRKSFVSAGLVQNLIENNYSPSDLKYPGLLGQIYL